MVKIVVPGMSVNCSKFGFMFSSSKGWWDS